ncbi:recombinase family protein [Bacillus sp. CGMCC 1.16607]|uniref:recombinase family protein n=1 Tax=Bacillus sp. CGMCC 1.16607 TaxID=3351842 RepID=UPI003637F688
MRCAIYRRVSTDMQVEEGVSLDNQLQRLRAFAESQGWTIVIEYVDEGISAKNIEGRPGIQSMMKGIIEKKFDVLLVYKLDRLVRRVKDLLELLMLMEKHEVMFKSATEPFDTTTPAGKLFITMIAAMAEWERETIAERVYDNLKHRAQEGNRNGGPAPYGYDYDDKGNLVINDEEAKWVRFIYKKYQTMGSQNIAKALNKNGIKTKKGVLWSDFSVRFILRNPIYSGKNRWNWRSPVKGKAYTGNEIIKDINQEGFQAIIPEEEFNDIQKLSRERSSTAFRSDNHYPFSGVAKCWKCGNSFTGAFKKRKTGGVYRHYKCAGRFKYGVCDVQTIAEEAMETALLNFLSFDELDIEIHEDQEEFGLTKEELDKQLHKIRTKKERTKDLYIDGEYSKDEYKKKMDLLTIQENELLEQYEEFEQEASIEEIKIVLQNIKLEWPYLSFEAKKQAVQMLFESFTIELVTPSKMGKYPEPPVVIIKDYRFR